MNVNCKQVMENLNPHHLNSELIQQERAELRQHLLECSNCRAAYEEVLHTVAVLESLPEPDPPPDLVERIQTRIVREHRKQSRLAFLVNPIGRLLTALKLGPPPTIVNYTALLFYLILTIFLVKLTFFSPTDSPPVSPITRLTDARMKSVAEPWAAVKYNGIQKEKTEEQNPSNTPTEAEDTLSDN
jgi:hypothetical protein